MQIHGNGSIVPLEDKPKYRCRKWRLFVCTEEGKKSRVCTGTWTDACKALEAFKNELSDKVPASETFASYAALWLVWRENSRAFATGTIANNAREVRSLCRSKLSTMRLTDITPQDCREALIWIKQNPQRVDGELSNTTMNKIFITLSAIFNQAVEDGIIRVSPMYRISPPKPDTQEKVALTPDELYTFVHDLDALQLDGRVMALYLMALLGLRRGEACALSTHDISNGIAYVHAAIKDRNGEISAPKSPAGIRRLPCPRLLLLKVDEWRDVRAYPDAPTLCHNSRGGVMRPQLLQRWWTGDSTHNGIREQLGYQDMTLHQLRHSNLSMMARYMSPFDLQRYAGWSSIEPARVYVHDDLASIRRAVDTVSW